tara:strand:+ start:986 stop:1690 length:705 start_codon:yes stop_codon:yes gene_type:complete
MSIKTLGEKYNCDKVIIHSYDQIYDKIFKDLKSKDISLLEIGLDNNKSLNIWLNYFDKAKIYGLDINPINYTHDRVTIIKGDQSNIDDLKKLQQFRYDIIIDDGSHHPFHQIFTFINLFDNLQQNGIYIIEDIECNYWTQGSLYKYNINCGINHPQSIIEIFKMVIDYTNRNFISDNTQVVLLEKLCKIGFTKQILDQIFEISFFRNGIKIIKNNYNTFSNKNYEYCDRGIIKS